MTDILNAFHWYIALLLIGVIAFPIMFRFLPHLPGKGYAFSKPLGLLLWGFVFWFFGELHVLQNSIGGEYLALGVLLTVSIIALGGGKGRELRVWLRENWKTILVIEVVFLLFFVFWAWVRSTNPEISGTEKPMEQAFINAILNSPSFPPRDPWLSGYAISYYYFGYVLIAMLIRIAGVVTGVGYNLTSASWFALTATAAFGLVADLVTFWQRGREKRPGTMFTEAQKALGRMAGILGSFFILFVSNLEGLLEVLHVKGVFWHKAADGTVTSTFWTKLGILDLNDPPAIFTTGQSMTLRSLFHSFTWSNFILWVNTFMPTRYLAWWRGSRVVRDLGITGGGIEIIDEFPFFSYLLSDLHPHVLAMPFDLLAIAICLNLFIAASENIWPEWKLSAWLKTWQFWLTALVLGSLAFLNTWDFPIYVGLFCLVLIYLKVKKTGWRGQRIWDFIAACLIYGIAGVLFFLPFFLGFKSQAGGFLPSLEFATRGSQFWIMFAPLMIPIFFWLFHQWRNTNKPGKFSKGASFTFYLIGGLWLVMTLLGGLVFATGNLSKSMASSSNTLVARIGSKLFEGFSALAGIHGTTDGYAVLLSSIKRRLIWPGEISSAGTWITLVVMLILVWGMIASSVKREEEPDAVKEKVNEKEQADVCISLNANLFVLFLVLVGIGLSGFPEFFYLRDQFGNRMNTIFKFYFQTWIIWGIAAAYGTVVLWNELKGWKQKVFTTIWLVIFACSLIYPITMLNIKMDLHMGTSEERKAEIASWTLDGNHYLSVYSPDEAAAIAWLNTAPDGIIVEAIGGSYSEFGHMSELTGKQTVLMWPFHEMQWRGGTEEMGSREEDIKTLYETDMWYYAQNILQKYNVKYVILGTYERSAYKVNQAKLDKNLKIVYQNNSYIIYEVPQSVLDGAK